MNGIRHVAERARVSTTAVSEVLAGVGRYAPATIARVKRAALDLNYAPSRRARAMQAGCNHCLAVVAEIPIGQDCSYQAMILTGIALEARRAGYSVDLAEAIDQKPLAPIFRNADGIIVSGLVPPPHLREIEQSGLPRVRVNPGLCDREDCVGPDDVGGAGAVGHLIRDRGYERVVYLAGPFTAHASVDVRSQALAEAVRGLDFRTVSGQPDFVALLKEYGGDGEGRTAFVGYGDRLLAGLLVAGAHMGLTCPKEFGLATCHLLLNEDVFQPMGIDMCGATHGLRHMGHEAGRMMLRKLRSGNRPQPTVLIPEVLQPGNTLRQP